MTTHSQSGAQDNLRGIALMILAMAGFAAEDALIKLSAAHLPTGQVVISIGLIGALLTTLVARRRGIGLFPRASFNRLAALRSMAELLAATCFTLAIVLTDLSSVSAILQATPLIVALGSAWFLGEKVGWRRYLAIFVGLGGVLLIIRPGAEAFQMQSLLAVIAAFGLAIRDLAIRASPPAVHSLVVVFQGMLVYAAAGVILLMFSDGLQQTSPVVGGYLVAAGLLGFLAYFSIIAAIRVGEVAVVAPFRYSRLIFGMIAGVVIFAERPDALTYVGAGIVVTTGLYTAWRERVRASTT